MVAFLLRRSLTRVANVLSMEKLSVVFVLGGPGAGKGTQCAKIVDKYGFVHLSAGDLLRKEKNTPGSEVGQLITEYIKEGKIVPVKITCGLLKKAMDDFFAESHGRKNKFLIDGFPRNQDNLEGWDEEMENKVNLMFVLLFDCPEEVCTNRILERGKTSGRTDDNIESLKKRFQTFINETEPVISHYKKLEKVHTIDAAKDPETVFAETSKLFD